MAGFSDFRKNGLFTMPSSDKLSAEKSQLENEGSPKATKKMLQLNLKPIISKSLSAMSPSPCSNSTTKDFVFSPMTNLALNLGQLNTSGESDAESIYDTPKRRLSLSSSSGSPTPVGSRLSWSEGKKLTSFDELRELQANLQQPCSTEKTRPKPTSLFRKIHSMPQHSYYSPLSLLEDAQRTTNLLLSPKFTSPHSKQNHHSGSFLFHDESSHDSGLGDNHSCKDEDFHFVEPVGLPPRSSGKKLSEINENTCSPIQYSPLKEKRINLLPPTCLFSPDEKCTSPRPVKGRTPLKVFNLNVSIEEDDGFLEMMDDIDDEDEKSAKEMNAKVSGFSDLIKCPILSSTSFAKSIENRENISPLWRKRIQPRGLFRSPSAPRLNLEQSYEKGRPMSFKRPDPPRDDHTPVMSKRRKSETNLSHIESESQYTPSRLAAKVERCNSDNEHTIKTALTRGVEEPNLIGDFSRAFCLPYVSGRHADLKYITPETYADVADGKYNSIVEDFVIIDCRYPYEFKGGHIKGAKNIYSPEDIVDEFMKNRKNVSDKNKRLIIIFHCEFSSERGPKLSRHLRKEDRAANTANYPGLCYPELYLLEGGYKALYQRPNLHRFCEPQGYTPMTHSDFAKELKHFRAKSKSWNGEKSSRLLFKLKC